MNNDGYKRPYLTNLNPKKNQKLQSDNNMNHCLSGRIPNTNKDSFMIFLNTGAATDPPP